MPKTTDAPTERELLQELVACRDWIDALPKDVTEARYFIAKQEAAVREVELWKQVRAHLAERTAKERVKLKYPDARAIHSGMRAWWMVYSLWNPLNKEWHKTPAMAWADAASRLASARD